MIDFPAFPTQQGGQAAIALGRVLRRQIMQPSTQGGVGLRLGLMIEAAAGQSQNMANRRYEIGFTAQLHG